MADLITGFQKNNSLTKELEFKVGKSNKVATLNVKFEDFNNMSSYFAGNDMPDDYEYFYKFSSEKTTGRIKEQRNRILLLIAELTETFSIIGICEKWKYPRLSIL